MGALDFRGKKWEHWTSGGKNGSTGLHRGKNGITGFQRACYARLYRLPPPCIQSGSSLFQLISFCAVKGSLIANTRNKKTSNHLSNISLSKSGKCKIVKRSVRDGLTDDFAGEEGGKRIGPDSRIWNWKIWKISRLENSKYIHKLFGKRIGSDFLGPDSKMGKISWKTQVFVVNV